MSTGNIRDVVKEKYGDAARRARTGKTSCCGTSDAREGSCDPITSNLYSAGEVNGVPDLAVQASLGCGNPTALADLNPGETVLDLGSGGGIDVLLSARRVGPSGKAYGLDMTDEMLALARENQRKAGVDNVQFLKGEIENIPLPDNSVDVIISNCVINLSADKDRVLREAFRVLKPGGRFAVSDVVVSGEVPPEIRSNVELWIGCIAGALRDTEYESKLALAGFEDISIEPTRIYDVEDARQILAEQGIDVDAIASQVDGKFMSAFIRASKPTGEGCCKSRSDGTVSGKGKTMEQLTARERELVALGAALGSNCVPCIEYHIPEARKAGLTDSQISQAVQLADRVRQVPAAKVLSAALGLLGQGDQVPAEKTCSEVMGTPSPAAKSKCCG
jgi:arsenite methyltransferase